MARPGEGFPGVGWWLEDPERWETLRFEAAHDEEDVPFDRRWRDRGEVLDALVAVPGPVDHAFARFLLEQEILFHDHAWGFNYGAEIAALLVAEHQRPEDVWILWEAIGTSFDTWCGLPHDLLLAGGGKASAIAYVAASDHDARDGLLEHLRESEEMTGEEAAAFVAARREYYAKVYLGGQ
ncbi:hypothetical protein [Actinomadura harenae]|uniref:hypothetical protein n=1 Tax=Actinomadura harenae TaxID=2483351 RepID=UPI0011C3691B|nr:hypothetical protein [Actinomadura harenae]